MNIILARLRRAAEETILKKDIPNNLTIVHDDKPSEAEAPLRTKAVYTLGALEGNKTCFHPREGYGREVVQYLVDNCQSQLREQAEKCIENNPKWKLQWDSSTVGEFVMHPVSDYYVAATYITSNDKENPKHGRLSLHVQLEGIEYEYEDGGSVLALNFGTFTYLAGTHTRIKEVDDEGNAIGNFANIDGVKAEIRRLVNKMGEALEDAEKKAKFDIQQAELRQDEAKIDKVNEKLDKMKSGYGEVQQYMETIFGALTSQNQDTKGRIAEEFINELHKDLHRDKSNSKIAELLKSKFPKLFKKYADRLTA